MLHGVRHGSQGHTVTAAILAVIVALATWPISLVLYGLTRGLRTTRGLRHRR